MKVTDEIEFKFLNKIIDYLKIFFAKHEWIEYIISPIFTSIILFTVFAIKSVYPFGLNSISYYDMPGSYIPIYTFAWDALHGVGGVYLNWFCGLAVSMADVVGNFLFFPSNLFFLFVSRDNILFSMSYFLVIKFSLCAFSMSFYYKKHYGDFTGTVASGILYAFCGFSIQYYFNIFYFDLVMIFPLIVFAFERMILKHKYILFTILMFFSFFTNVQLVFMLGIYLVYKGFFMLKKIPQEKKGESIRLFAISVIIAAMMACFILLPSITQTMLSSRKELNSGFDYESVMKTVYNEFKKQKRFIMYGSEIAVGLFLLVVCRGKTIISKYFENILMIVMLSLPILHEGINLLWHAGSYKHFPVRFGYMLTFECMIFVGEYFKNEKFSVVKYIGKIAKLLGVAVIPFLAYILYNYFKEYSIDGISNLEPYPSYWIYFITLSISYFIFFIMESTTTRKIVIVVLAIIQAFCGSYGFIAPEKAYSTSTRYIYTMNSINHRTQLRDEDLTKRIKSNPAEYESNYSIELEQPSIASWLYGLSAETESELRNNMGYDGTPSYVMDSGGTVFTDALLGVTKLISSENLDTGLYITNNNKKDIWDSKFTLPFGLVISTDKLNDDSVLFEYNNKLFKQITNINEQLINSLDAEDLVTNKHMLSKEEKKELDKIIEPNAKDKDTISEKINSGSMDLNGISVSIVDEDIKRYILEIPIKNESTIYLATSKGYDGTMNIFMDDKPIPMKSFSEIDDYVYPNILRNGIITLGSYKNTKLILLIYTSKDDLNGITIGILNHDILTKGIEAVKGNQDLSTHFYKNGMEVVGKINKEGILFLPIGYSGNWNAKLNGKRIKVKPCINDAFICVDVPKGDVDIKFTYIPQGLIIGLVISILGIILFIVMARNMRKDFFSERVKGIVDYIFLYGYYAIVVIMFLLMYVVPVYIKMAL